VVLFNHTSDCGHGLQTAGNNVEPHRDDPVAQRPGPSLPWARRRPAICFKLGILTTLLVMTGLNAPLRAATTNPVRVMILPFRIHATDDMAYLSTQIAQVLADRLKQDGAVIVDMDTNQALTADAKGFDTDKIRQIARQYQADQVIWGSFTLIGDSFSLDARMTGPTAMKAPVEFHVEDHGLDNLLKALNELGQQIGMKLFQREIVAAVHITGNQRIESDAILRMVKTRVGGVYQKDQISKDLKSIFEMGYFDDLRADAESSPDGKIVTFHVKEKPTIRRIKTTGNLRFDDDKIKESLTISTGAILNLFKIRSNIEQIETMYKEKNYHKVKVDYKIVPLANNQADIEFIIDEGPKLYVTDIEFEGNKSFTPKRLKKVIQTKEKGFFYWLTSSGDLDRTKLDQDTALLNNFYLNQGYINARVGDPQVDIGEENIRIIFKIEEGDRYKVGRIDVTGDMILPKKELLKDLSLGKSTYFDREKLRNDVIALTDLYGNYGYAHADVKPMVKENHAALVVDVTYEIEKHQEVYFENILISGNTRTRDKVIRRELDVHEQERFNGADLKKSIRKLYRLDYFEDIKVDSLKGSSDDKMVLKIDVTEKPTGSFTFGAGYSSEENLFVVGSIAQRNFLGRGQTLQLEGQFGGSTTLYDLSFTEPWLFDIPLSTTANAYDQDKQYTEYDRHSEGGGLRFSYPVAEFTRFYWSYSYDLSDVTITASDPDTVDDSIKELVGTNATSSASIALGYDSRDSLYNPTEGSKHSLTFEYAGLGGDVGFDKLTADTGWYFPLFKGLIGFAHGKAGWVRQNSDDKILPDYEKFYLGGINSLRGFDYRGVHRTHINSEGVATEVGGTEMVQFNFEMIFPISKKSGVVGVVFYDTGNVYEDNIDLGNLRRTAGFGLRWFSPLAPIRIEYGEVLDRKAGEGSGRWEFSMGGAF
jgi:outer membrane protein insertion porin family